MAKITVSDLRPAGSALFSDDENYMSELSDRELGDINGGVTPIIITVAVTVTLTVTRGC